MASPLMKSKPITAWPEELPLLYEDEEEPEMGVANLHTLDDDILFYGLKAFFKEYHPVLQVYSNMNLYYRDGPRHKKTGSKPYISPDIMVVHPPKPLPKNLKSYTVGKDGPAPRLTMEVLSEGTAEKLDLKDKPKIFAFLGVGEYILIDPTGDVLPERLLLKRLRPDGTWKDERDADGGVTSRLGFRIIIETDGEFRVVDARTGKRYIRPEEAQTEAEARQQAEERAGKEAAARQKTEEKARKEAVARQKTEEKARKAEEQAKKEGAERQLAEQRNRELEMELERLRKLLPPQN